MDASEKKIRKKILVVDDEERICDAVKRALERTGYQVEASLSALDALEAIHKGALDMVICDIKMPGM
ncbi:MAG: response regulator, partial [Betaproteobacteria bacterium]|nr:response regulator [Betaproteobacteria bacterium]